MHFVFVAILPKGIDVVWIIPATTLRTTNGQHDGNSEDSDY
jgi:hypothetical protein